MKFKAAVIDADGVFYDYVSSLARVASLHLGRDISEFEPAKVWNFFSEQWGISLATYLELVEVGVQKYGLLRYGEPYGGAVEGTQKLLEAGVVVHIATDLKDDERYRKARLDWFSDIGIDLGQVAVTFTANKDEVAREYLDKGAQVFALDDKIENYEALAAAGADSYLLSQDWNAKLEGAQRVRSVEEFADVVIGAN